MGKIHRLLPLSRGVEGYMFVYARLRGIPFYSAQMWKCHSRRTHTHWIEQPLVTLWVYFEGTGGR